MRRIVSLAGALAVGAGILMAGTGVAEADPYDCTTWQPHSDEAAARCTNGTGEYRAHARCNSPGNPDYDAYGLWVRVGKTSVAQCSRYVFDRVKTAGVQVR
ncbi:hypothetical protein SAMN05421504_1209 [Amycolatopsis xylanica]|uniref:Secreted protein n=1 Tax=Amycolatopsis xylanica TaxID=589385 RepID=A0A1H3T8G7_9PSEU|nr:hypothetical protein [Amycolatopsis xylanica]SDZ46536.1 hypothetical protein SAMN05421504_1209 [Amycolatopsis xylanica]